MLDCSVIKFGLVKDFGRQDLSQQGILLLPARSTLSPKQFHTFAQEHSSDLTLIVQAQHCGVWPHILSSVRKS